MSFEKLGQTIAKVAPLLGAVLPIPGGVILGQAVASLFGGDANNPDDLIQRINQDPDAALKLAQFEMNHKLELEKISLQAFQTEIASTHNAQLREIALAEIAAKTGNAPDKTTSQLAIITISGFFIYIFSLLLLAIFNLIDQIELSMFNEITKILVVIVGMVLGYYFGGSKYLQSKPG
jgi:hypothetical protein